MYSQKGNLAFMFTVGTAAVLSASTVIVLGLTQISLAIFIVLIVSSVIFGKWFENKIAAKEQVAEDGFTDQEEDAFYSEFEKHDQQHLE